MREWLEEGGKRRGHGFYIVRTHLQTGTSPTLHLARVQHSLTHAERGAKEERVDSRLKEKDRWKAKEPKATSAKRGLGLARL